MDQRASGPLCRKWKLKRQTESRGIKKAVFYFPGDHLKGGMPESRMIKFETSRFANYMLLFTTIG